MMEGQRVHEYTVEQGDNGLPIARIGRIRNLITFVREGSTKFHYLDGAWVDDGGHAIDEATVPEELKRQVKAIPFKGAHQSANDVLVFCEFCVSDQPMTQADYVKHLSSVHVRKAAPAPVEALEEAIEPVEELEDDDSFVRDEDGDVVLNKDGSKRKKAGRPRKE